MGFLTNATNFNVVQWEFLLRVFLSTLEEKYGYRFFQ
jgi:hypothetical protein